MQQRGLIGNHCTACVPGVLTDAMSIADTITESNHDSNNHENGKVNGASVNGATYTNKLTHSKLLVWSAADQKALRRMLENYKTASTNLGLGDTSKLDHLAVTLASRRSQMLWRAFAVFPSAEASQETKVLSPVKPVRSSTDTGLAFVFTGQGAQYAGMGLDLIRYPMFARTLREVDDIYGSLGCEWSIFGKQVAAFDSTRLTTLSDEIGHGKNIDKPEYSQPICTAIQIGLVELLESFGITPKAVVGHSSGEIAAAYVTMSNHQ